MRVSNKIIVVAHRSVEWNGGREDDRTEKGVRTGRSERREEILEEKRRLKVSRQAWGVDGGSAVQVVSDQ
jgi:hypothetical protein